MSDYKPISCDFHSYLEHYATSREVVRLVWKEEEKLIENEVSINDLYTKKGEEFIVLSNALTLRLDQIVSINDQVLDHSCG